VRRWRILFPVLEFLETQFFTRAITALLTDAEYSELQGTLLVDPEVGDRIPGTGGLRKVRWRENRRGKGKRGGIRVIYYWYQSGSLVYMLLAYSKGQRDDLTTREKNLVKGLVAEEFR
jgi:mRNA-degrading endonuclease RelE of RelBE toxin-antitoxin system